jgi:hypothetical protein
MDYLTGGAYAGIITDASPIGSQNILVQLGPDYDFFENRAKELIESDGALAGVLHNVGFNGLVTIVGEEYPLFRGYYPGFQTTILNSANANLLGIAVPAPRLRSVCGH